MSSLKSLQKYLRYLVLIAIVVASLRIFLFSFRFFLRTEHPLVYVNGPSMEPTLYDGDLLVLKGVDNKSSIKLLEIIVFREPTNPDHHIIHRIIQKIIVDTRVEFITKGDNNPSSDYDYWGWTVGESDVIGVVTAKVPPVIASIITVIESQVTIVFAAAILILAIGVDIITDKETGNKEGKNRKVSL